ncbi:uncharacterized protein KZ484_013593 isoform 2-T3 [Pholidichthys leucotaenia]
MPELRAAAVIQAVLLLSAVPAQYLISRWVGSTQVQRYHATTRLLRIWKEWRASHLNVSAWVDWTSQQMTELMSMVGLAQEDQIAQESPPMEAMIFDNDQGFFGASKMVRSPHPPFVFLKVGEVVMEREGHMIGVVVSWDPELRAPPEWVNKETIAERTPHYKVLFSGPVPSSVIIAYLPQTQLARISGIRPDIPTLENYFTHFNGNRFIMRPWLRQLFPEDEDEDNSLA